MLDKTPKNHTVNSIKDHFYYFCSWSQMVKDSMEHIKTVGNEISIPKKHSHKNNTWATQKFP